MDSVHSKPLEIIRQLIPTSLHHIVNVLHYNPQCRCQIR
jgi:hypothetical protein